MMADLPDMSALGKELSTRLTTLESGKLDKTAKAVSANTADTASAAVKLQTARTIAISGKVTGTATAFDGSAAITINATSATDDTKAAISGARGTCAGYETASTSAAAVTINASSADSMVVTGAVAITLADGAAGTAFTKNVLITDAGATITPGAGWKWAGGKVPEMKANSLLVAKWLGTLGVLSLIYTE